MAHQRSDEPQSKQAFEVQTTETHRAVYFVPDGGPTSETCGWSRCSEQSVGVFLVIDDDTNAEIGTVDLCDSHASRLATGYVRAR